MFDKTDYEKQAGLTSVYDVSSEGLIAYVVYESGKPGIYLQHDVEEFQNPVFQLDVNQEISDISFSPDGSSLAYIVGNKEKQVDPGGLVLLLDVETLEQKRLFQKKGLVTEIKFDPKDSDLLFFLSDESMEDESNTSVRSYQYDIFGHRISEAETIRYTELKQYAMHSLNISNSDNAVFVQMDSGTKQRIFRIPIEQPENMSIVSKQDRTTDIYDFTIVPDKNEVIFQSASTTNNNGTYEYELYHYNWEDDQERQLTYLKESASRPIINPQDNKVSFMVDYQFGKKSNDYHLHQMDLNGENIEEVKLDIGQDLKE